MWLYGKRTSEYLWEEEGQLVSTSVCRYLFVMNLVLRNGTKFPLQNMDQSQRDSLTLVDIEVGPTGEEHAYLFRIDGI